ncbi:BglG family transcription antiterminator [Enterococcus avium]|uniref:BglG family transcription antiterminator n=1 Tax=Enterococcus avium TaxID=33945 RepID=UPI00289244A3|nr:PRD domain-containing protein [Enterococcus avium]MDT2390035.1 PRD domain-containing protein [Enterococcus avium]
MQLSKRETQLIELFIKHGMTLTAQELAEFANVSTKTIYRTIKKINEASDVGELISAEVGKGFRLDYDNYLKESVRKRGNDTVQGPSERRNTILLALLFKSPKKVLINDLFDEYYVSNTVITNDLVRMNEFLLRYQLSLIRKGQRVSIEGTEKHIRKAVNHLISANRVWEEDFSTQQEKISSYDINFITSLLEYIERKLQNGIAYPYNSNIFSHIYILIKRVREGEIHADTCAELLDPDEEALITQYDQLYQLSKMVITKLNRKSKEALAITDFFATEMSRLMGMKVDHQPNRQDLYEHIDPLLYRLKNEIIVKNDLLGDIKLEYPEVFQQVQQVSKAAEEKFQLNEISEDEIGFLTLYFVKYKEMIHSKKRVLIMCSSGVGTSELLKVKVRKAFPELEIVDVLSARKFSKASEKYQNIDLILTTVNLTIDMMIPTILVNSVFTKQDEKRVKEMLGEI